MSGRTIPSGDWLAGLHEHRARGFRAWAEVPAAPPAPRLAPQAYLHSRDDLGGLHSYALTSGHDGHGCCFDGRSRRYTLVARRWSRVDIGTGECGGAEFMVLPARCKSYACPCCGPRLIARNRARASAGLGEPGEIALLTVTLDPEHPAYLDFLRAQAGILTLFGRPTKRIQWVSTAEDERALSVRYLSRAWNRFVTYLRRFEPRHVCPGCSRMVGGYPRVTRHARGCSTRRYVFHGLGFFKGLELQRNGRAHAHALLRVESYGDLDRSKADLLRLADACGFGGRRKWRDAKGRLRSGTEWESPRSAQDVARYVAKAAGVAYGMQGRRLAVAGEVAKARQARFLPARARRASWSMGARDWAPGWVRPLRSLFTWEFSTQDPVSVERRAVSLGMTVRPDRFGRVERATAPPSRLAAAV